MNGASAVKIIELIVVSGAVAGFCLWQLRTLTKLRREREKAPADERTPRETENS